MGLACLLAPLAFLLDLLIGDPARKTHPVLLMGAAITRLLEGLKKFGVGKVKEILQGIILALTIVAGSYFLTAALVKVLGLLSPLLFVCMSVWLISTTIAAKGLAEAAREVACQLKEKDLDGARKSVAMIVGRDTDKMTEEEIVRATVETVAENTVDALVSPLFYAFIGGAPLAIAYRAVNTLDSMVGYKNDEFRYLGWASARLDDLVNYLPARITGILMVLASLPARENTGRALRMLCRDARKHSSPNSGIPESVTAGALGVQLGGRNIYRGKVSSRAYMGDPVYDLDSSCIDRANRLMYITGVLAVLLGIGIVLVWSKYF